MSTKTRNRKQQAARNRKNTQTKQQPAPAQPDTREPLPRRSDWTTHALLTEARAALDAGWLRLGIPVLSWTASPHGGATTTITLTNPDVPIDIRHTANDGRIGEITATIHCPSGIPHIQRITSRADLAGLHAEGTGCRRHHGGKQAHQAITDGVRTTPRLEPARVITPVFTPVAVVKPVKIHPLPEGIHRATAAADETQPMSTQQIAAAIAQTADTENAKEHPQP